MNKESEFAHIVRKTGRKPVECKCQGCKDQCRKTPCLGTPADILRIIEAGYADHVKPTTWATGMVLWGDSAPIEMYQLEQAGFNSVDGGCVFFEGGLCRLHEPGLKPTEGRLSHHTQYPTDRRKSITWNVAKTWLDPHNAETVQKIELKLLAHELKKLQSQIVIPADIKVELPIQDPEDNDEDAFQPCSGCDGHDACHDYGCAIKSGIIDDPSSGIF